MDEERTVVSAIDADRIIGISTTADGKLREIAVDTSSEVITYETPMSVQEILARMEGVGIFSSS